MAAYLNKQGAVLDEIKSHLITLNENAKKLKKKFIKLMKFLEELEKKIICL